MLTYGLIDNSRGVSYPLINREFGVSWEQQGFLVSILAISYVGFSIVAGIFLSRFGIKPLFLFGFAALCIGVFSVFFMHWFFWTGTALFVMYAGFGFFEVGLNALASRLFIRKAALLMSLLHSFYGIGAIIGPKAAGLIANDSRFGWRYAYLISLPLALLFFIMSIFSDFPTDDKPAAANASSDTDNTSAVDASADTGNAERGGKTAAGGRRSFFDALRNPLVWLMSVILGLAVVVEMNSANWGAMYFRDVHGVNPSTGGAAFLSSFFLVFTISRLVCGPLIEKIGYVRSLLGAACIVLVIYTAGFFMGAKGVYVLPAQGFFVAPLWPTIMAVAISVFGRDAPVFSSAMIAIGGFLNAGVQFLIGLTNKTFGPAWGYRSTVVYTVLLIAALLMLVVRLKVPAKGAAIA